jgi:hypothetical protein
VIIDQYQFYFFHMQSTCITSGPIK